MRYAAPQCPEGYYLYYMRGAAHGKFTMVWLMARVEPVEKLSPEQLHNDRKVALIQEMDDGGTYLAFVTARDGENAMQNTDPQELITSVCAVDRLTLGEPA